MKDNKYLIPVLLIATVIVTIMGGTLAYWNWQTTNAQKTNVTFTIGANFSCGADGGGNITSNTLAPTDCTNTTYAIQRTITTSLTNNSGEPVYMDMWLNINSIGSGLTNSDNFRYALTTSSSSCTTGVVSQGTFQGKAANDKVELLSGVTTASTYYLYIWLDAAETSSSTMNQSVSLSLGGECTNHNPYVYTANSSDDNIWLGSPIPNNITTYNTPEAALAALKAAGNGTTNYPFFLRHKIGNGTMWCAVKNADKYCIYASQAECNSELASAFGNDYTCQSQDYTEGVSESYVGFIITPEMVTTNPGMIAGTYYLKGGDNGRAYNNNIAVLKSAFGENNSYCEQYSSSFWCNIEGMNVMANLYGSVDTDDDNDSICAVNFTGNSACDVF